MSYIGKSPGIGVRSRYYFTATGGETSLSGTDDNGATLLFSDGTYVDVMLNGINLVAGTDYNTSTANTIGGLAALSASDVVEIVVYDVFSVADTVSKTNGGTFDGAVVFGSTATHQGAATFQSTTTHQGAATFQSTATFQDEVIIDTGTTAERPASPATGSVRYNTTLELYEGYNGKEWTALSATKTPDIYPIDNSLRFNDDDTAYLSRTPASAGDRKTWTWSAWVKRGNLGGNKILFNSITGFTQTNIQLLDDELVYIDYAGTPQAGAETSALFRDPSAWYHIVVAVDTTQAAASERLKFYVNGKSYSYVTRSGYPSAAPALNYSTQINNTLPHYVGGNSNYFDGYMSDVYFIDGQALDPTSFGEFDDNGVWNPIAFTGTYGTNGFFLEFKTDSALGTDTSGNGNDWTPSGITTDDQVLDTPSVNYATWNPLTGSTLPAYANGNLFVNSSGSANFQSAYSTFGVSSGKWYAEFVWSGSGGGNTSQIGVASYIYPRDSANHNAIVTGATVANLDNATTGYKVVFVDGTRPDTTDIPWVVGDTVGIALDADNNQVRFYRNGTEVGASSPYTATLLAGGNYYFFAPIRLGADFTANFGQRPFAYTPPTGFQALNSANLPAPTITDGKEHFEPALYTGNGATQDIGGLEFQPDFVWIKNRDAGLHHVLSDAVRGAQNALFSSTTSAEFNSTINVTAFNSNGFTVGTGTNTNASGQRLVAWNWYAGGTTVTNTDGTITSQVRANPSAGFSIVTYTGSGSNATVGHGLNTAPAFIITKKRSNTSNWAANAPGRTNPWDGAILLNSTDAFTVSSAVWQDTAPTSTVFSIGTADAVNIVSETYVAYCFAPVDGYSSFGSYTGNGSADGPFVYTGFRPAFVMFKRTDAASQWGIFDTKRSSSNLAVNLLYPNNSSAETTNAGRDMDILSNGFKLRSTSGDSNASGGTYIYMAFAENPFKTARAR